MSAGSSDYGNIASGQIGQGIGQGIQQASDNYQKGVDRKVAQANTYLTSFIGPNLQRLGRAEERPPVGSPPEEFAAWARREDERQRMLQANLSQSEQYLKLTGSPVDAQSWAGLWYDPSSAVSPQELKNISQNAGKYATVTTQLQGLRTQLGELDPTSEQFKEVKGRYDKLLADTGYAGIFKTVTGVEYSEIVGTEDFTKAVAKDRAKKLDMAFLNSMAGSKNSTVAGIASEALANPNFDINTVDPKTGKSLRSLLTDMVDDQQLLDWTTSSNPEAIGNAIMKLDSLATNPEQFDKLPASVKAFYQEVQDARKDPANAKASPISDAVRRFTLTGQAVVQGQQTININGVDYKTKSLNYSLAFGEQAAAGNAAVLTDGAKAQFVADQMEQGATKEQAEANYEKAVTKPYNDFVSRQALNMRSVEANLEAVTLSNQKTVADTVKDGTYHLIMGAFDKEGNYVIDKDSKAYQAQYAIYGPLTDSQITSNAQNSLTAFSNLQQTQQQNLQLGAAQLKIANSQVVEAAVNAKYAEVFAQQRAEDGKLTLDMKKIDAAIKPAQAKGEMGILLSNAVQQLGVGVLSDPEFKATFTKALGGEAAYNAAAAFMTQQQSYRDRVQKNQLTIQGQQINSSNLDEFDRMFKSPAAIATYLKQPDKVRALAIKAGVSPQQAMAALAQLHTENRALTSLQIEQMRTGIWATKEGVKLQGSEFLWRQSTDQRDFSADQAQREVDNGFRASAHGLDVMRFEADQDYRLQSFQQGVMESARNYGLDVARLQLSKEDSIRNFQALFLTPLNESVNIVTGQLQAATGQREAYLENSSMKAVLQNIKWVPVKTNPDGSVVYRAEAGSPEAKKIFAQRKAEIDQYTALYNAEQGFASNLQGAKQLYTNLVNQGTSMFPGLGTAEVPRVGAPQATASAAGAKIDLKTYSKAGNTVEGQSLAAAAANIVNGRYPDGFGNILSEGYCTTFVQGLMTMTMNVPGGIPIGGPTGALGFKQSLLKKGASTIPASGPGGRLTAADIRNLPDGTILVQNDNTKEGHVGIVIGGVVVQNSRYKDSKISGAVGTMSIESFVKAFPTTGHVVPDSWYRGGTGPGAKPAVTTTRSPATTPQTTGGTTAPRQPVNNKYRDSDGNFAPNAPTVAKFISPFINKYGKGVTVTSSPGGASGLSYEVGKDRFVKMVDTDPKGVAQTAVNMIATQFGVYLANSTGGNMAGAYKANPTQLRNSLKKELQTAGFSGDLDRFITQFFKSKGW